MMEMMKQPYLNILAMPYKFFIDTLDWKIKLEDEKKKYMEEKMHNKSSSSSKIKSPTIRSAMKKVEHHKKTNKPRYTRNK